MQRKNIEEATVLKVIHYLIHYQMHINKSSCPEKNKWTYPSINILLYVIWQISVMKG
jgi:hypothetical protein